MKRILLFIIILPCFLIGRSQVVQENDSTIVLTLEEARIVTQMTEDLRWTKSELAIADSIITHQDSVISLKNQMIDYKEYQLQENLRISKKQKIKTGFLSGGIGVVVGVLLGLLLR